MENGNFKKWVSGAATKIDGERSEKIYFISRRKILERKRGIRKTLPNQKSSLFR
jgi:hypothetical protein